MNKVKKKDTRMTSVDVVLLLLTYNIPDNDVSAARPAKQEVRNTNISIAN